MDKPRDLRGGAGTSWKIACAVGRDLTLGQLAELLVRDRLLAAEVRAAMERAPSLPWDSRVPRIGEAPRRAPERAEQLAQPSAPVATERAPERAPGVAPVAAAAVGAGQGGGAAAAAPRRGVFGRRTAPAVPAAAVRSAGELEAQLQEALRQRVRS